MNDLLDVTLAIVVARMGLAGKDELDVALPVVDQLHDVLELLEDKRGALVGGEPPGEADGERVRVEQLIKCDEITLGEAAALDEQAAARKLD